MVKNLIGMYKHRGIIYHQLLAILTDTVLCIEKTSASRWTSCGSDIFFFRLCPLFLLRDVIIIITDCRNESMIRGLV